LIFRAPLTRRGSCETFENGSEMSLSLKAYSEGDLDDRHLAVSQQLLGTTDALAKNEFVGSQSCRDPELRSKVHSAQPGDGCQARQADLVRQVGIDIFDDPLQTPLLQRLDRPSIKVCVARAVLALRLRPGEPGRYRQPQSLGAILIMLKLNSLQCNGKGPNDVVAGFVCIYEKGNLAAATRILRRLIGGWRGDRRKR